MDNTNVSLEHSLGIINGLTREYHTIWLINYKNDTIKLFRSDNKERLNNVIKFVNSGGDYNDIFKQYIDNLVAPDFRETIARQTSKENVLEQLREHGICSFEFKRLTYSGDEAWHEMTFAWSPTEDGDIEENCVLGIRNIDEKKRYEAEIEAANERIEEQLYVLQSVAQTYHTMHIIDLVKDEFYKYAVTKELEPLFVNESTSARVIMKDVMLKAVVPEQRKEAIAFTDLETIADRLQNKKSISSEFVGEYAGWFLATFVNVDSDGDGRPNRVVFTTQVVDERKQKEELLRHQSETDELTGFFNRRKYENDLNYYRENPVEDDFIFISLDVNRLKFVNDNLGHVAGDELLCGAVTTMLESFSYNSKFYRVGGDEFAIIAHASEEELKEMTELFQHNTGKWTGNLVENLSVSYGIVLARETEDMSIDQIAILADKRMYESKSNFYKQMHYDRRAR